MVIISSGASVPPEMPDRYVADRYVVDQYVGWQVSPEQLVGGRNQNGVPNVFPMTTAPARAVPAEPKEESR